jgi:UDP-N-acetylglucosamine 2-epimerase
MKIVTVVGARPQFVKASVVSTALREAHEEIIIHTGQHYDFNMSQIFFTELNIPSPDYNLGISSTKHGKMTGAMLASIEDVLLYEKPKMLLVYGDTNSTLAGALAAVKLHIPVCHVEAGNRLGSLTNPEEINRICTDHTSSLLLSCVPSAIEFLKKEGITTNVYLVGDPMLDVFKLFANKVSTLSCLKNIEDEYINIPSEYYYLTCHREENTASEYNIVEILNAMNCLEHQTIYPVHPRNLQLVRKLCSKVDFHNIMFIEPVGYLTSINLIQNAKKIVTDSGGVQREAFFAGVPCVTVFDYICWPETMIGKRNQLAKANSEDILTKLSLDSAQLDKTYLPFGEGNSSQKIVSIISAFLNNGGK